MRPFLKWAGGKHRLLQRIQDSLPSGRRLLEPFVGSGAVFLNTDFSEYLLADSNPDLIHLFQILKEEGEPFVDFCQSYFSPETNSPEQYYAHREAFNKSSDPVLKAALFTYLNRHCFNGLCRYNREGGFNVPFGRYKKPYFPREEMLAFQRKSERATFVQLDFIETFAAAQPGDVIYCDPPYVPLSATAHFTQYAQGDFTLEDQKVLALLAQVSSEKGIPVVISNHHTEFTLEAYQAARVEKFEVRRHISCKGTKRAKASELLAVFQ